MPYNANLGVEFRAHRPDGTPIVETTVAPLDRKIDGDEAYFKLVGYSLPKLRVRPILGHIATVHESWNLLHQTVTATSHKGVIRVSKITHIPYVTIHLSNGTTGGVAIGWTSANP